MKKGENPFFSSRCESVKKKKKKTKHIQPVGPWRHRLDRPRMRSESSLHSPHVPHARIVLPATESRESVVYVCADADPHLRFGVICILDRPLWWIFCVWSQAQL